MSILLEDPVFLTVFVVLSLRQLNGPTSISIGAILLTTLISMAVSHLFRVTVLAPDETPSSPSSPSPSTHQTDSSTFESDVVSEARQLFKLFKSAVEKIL